MLKAAFVWTDDAIAEAVEMWGDGRSAGQIAEFFTISRNAVAGMISRNRELFARRSSVSLPSTNPLSKRGQLTYWTDETVAKAVQLWNSGASGVEISNHIGCAPATFSAYNRTHRHLFPKRVKADEALAAKRQQPPAFERSSQFDFTGYRLPDVQPVTFLAVGVAECRWPIHCDEPTAGAEMLVCAAETGGMVYCPAHASIAYGRGTESERSAVRALRRMG